MLLTIVTISRQMCSLGDEIAEALARKTGWELITRNTLLERFFKEITSPYEYHMLQESSRFFIKQNKNTQPLTYLEYFQKELKEFSQQHSVILVGFGSQVIFADDKDALHVRIIASQPVRISRVKRLYHVADQEAEKILITADKKHKKFVSSLYDLDLSDLSLYQMTLNTSTLSVDEGVAAVFSLSREHEARRQIEKQSEESETINHQSEQAVFKNPAEIEFARILDMYHIEWTYEPKTFPIEWDSEGNVTQAFSPDFYLTQFDTYIELTTMNQKYVTMKNKKARKVQELYPGTHVKIVYKKDFLSLVERFKMFGG